MAGDQRQPGTGLPIQPGPAQSVSGPISAAGINISTLAIGCLGIVIVVVLIFLVISFLTHHL